MTEDTFKDMIVFVDAAAVSDTTFQDLDRYALLTSSLKKHVFYN